MNHKSKPIILIDLKKDRIRIHKSTIHLLGDPEYILLLVNPEDKTIIIMRGDSSDRRTHKLNLAKFENKQSFELYSKSLVSSLYNISDNWQENQSYRIQGDFIVNEGIVMFHTKKSIPIYGT